jgi:basic membrane protein A
MKTCQYLYKFMFLIILSLALASCAGVGGNGSSASAASAPSAFQMAILLPGPIDDNGWSQTGYEGLKLVEKELGAQVAYTANVPQEESEQQKILRQYAEDGFNFIVGHGGEYQAAMEVVAKEFPQTRFALMTSYAGNNKNLGALAVRADEGGYLAGVVAGLKTKTNKIAYIGSEIYPSTQEEVRGFEQGVKSVNPSAEISITWVESWSDQDKAREIALAQVAAGADILAVDADIAGLAALEVAKDEGVYAIGWVQDQHELAPDVIVTSVLQQLPTGVLEAATLVQQGRWEGKQYKFGVREGIIGLAPFYGLLTPAEEELVQKVREDMIAGKIEILP